MADADLDARVRALLDQLRAAIEADADPSDVVASLAALTAEPDVSLEQAMAVIRAVSSAAADLVGDDGGALREIAALAGGSPAIREAVETAGLVQRMLAVASGPRLAAALRPLTVDVPPHRWVAGLREALEAAPGGPTMASLIASLTAAEAELDGRTDPAAWEAVLAQAELADALDLAKAAVDRLQPPALAAEDWERVFVLADRVAGVALAVGDVPQTVLCRYEQAICLSRLARHEEAADLASSALGEARAHGLAALVPRGRLVVGRVQEERGDAAAAATYAALRDDLAADAAMEGLRARAALGLGRTTRDPRTRGPALALARDLGAKRRDVDLYREASVRLTAHHAEADDLPAAVAVAVESRIAVAVMADREAAAPFSAVMDRLGERFGIERVHDEALAVVRRLREG